MTIFLHVCVYFLGALGFFILTFHDLAFYSVSLTSFFCTYSLLFLLLFFVTAERKDKLQSMADIELPI